jgi:hypothetical protein
MDRWLSRYCLNDVIRLNVENIGMVGKGLKQLIQIVVSRPHQMQAKPTIQLFECSATGRRARAGHGSVVSGPETDDNFRSNCRPAVVNDGRLLCQEWRS